MKIQFSKIIFPLLFLNLFIFFSCSEGDVIETDINFEEQTLMYCNIENKHVFYKLQNNNTEVLFIEFSSSNFDPSPTTLPSPRNITFNSTTNRVVYRSFSEAIDPDTYFCSNIPPSQVNVQNELISTTGTATIAITQETVNGVMIHRNTVTLNDITLENEGSSFRQDILLLGTYDE
ncbi:hypothetical protein [Aquimarina rhabdastrellae]